MDHVDGLWETCRAWADCSGDPDTLLWGDCIQMERARAVLANVDAAVGAGALTRLRPGIAVAFGANRRSTVWFAMDHRVLSALCAVAADVPQDALAEVLSDHKCAAEPGGMNRPGFTGE